MAQAFNPSTQEAEAGGSEFEASLVSMVNSRTARATQRNPVLKEKERNQATFKHYFVGRSGKDILGEDLEAGSLKRFGQGLCVGRFRGK